MEKTDFPDYLRCSACNTIVSQSNRHTHMHDCKKSCSVDSAVEQKLCPLCDQKIDSSNYADHVSMCMGPQKSLSKSVPLSTNQRSDYECADIDNNRKNSGLLLKVKIL